MEKQKEVDFGTALVDLYDEVKDRDITPPEHKLVKIYIDRTLKGCKVAEGVIQIEIEEKIK